MAIKKTKVKCPKVGYLGFTLENGYLEDFGFCQTESGAKNSYAYYFKVENWPDPDEKNPGICVGSIKL